MLLNDLELRDEIEKITRRRGVRENTQFSDFYNRIIC